MQLFDQLTLDGPRRDSAGNMIASVLAARTGIQDYAGYEVGKPEMPRVRVYRPAEEVFSRDSMRSYAGAPVAIDHPREAVTPSNWKDHAVGEVASDDIVKDGEAIRVPFMLRDAKAIDAVEAGKRQISMGYDCELDWTPGKLADGQEYDAIQRNIRINHLAIVDRARGGPSLRIGDSDMTTKTITFDGLPLLVTDAAEAALNKLQAKLDDAAKTITAKDADLAKKDAEIDDLKGKVLDAAALDARVAARSTLIASALKIAPALKTDGLSDADIRKQAVVAKLGDGAIKDKTAAYIDARFDILAEDAAKQTPPNKLDDAIGSGVRMVANDGGATVRNLARQMQF